MTASQGYGQTAGGAHVGCGWVVATKDFLLLICDSFESSEQRWGLEGWSEPRERFFLVKD